MPVQPNLDQTTRPATAKPSPTNTRSNANSGASAIEKSLNNALGGDPNAGLRGGSRAGRTGSPGSPTGNPNGDWYRTLIKNTLERYWMKPQSDNPNLATTIKISILADGTIQYLGMTGGSGDAAMAHSVISAVTAAKKIPVPPPAGFKIPSEDTVIFKLKSDW
jgi:membrane protein involved in colicin uptake